MSYSGLVMPDAEGVGTYTEMVKISLVETRYLMNAKESREIKLNL